MVKAVLQQQPDRFGTQRGVFHPSRPGDMADLNRAHFPLDRHIADDAHRLLATQVNHRIRHQSIIIHLARDPVGGRRHALRPRRRQPRPVAVVAERIGGKQIRRMTVNVQRLQSTKTAI